MTHFTHLFEILHLLSGRTKLPFKSVKLQSHSVTGMTYETMQHSDKEF